GVGLALFAALVGTGLFWLTQTPPEAAAAALSPATAAGLQTTDKLVITIGLANPDAARLRGNLEVELLDAAGQTLARREQKVEQADRGAGYRFELPAVKGPADKLTLRCRFGQQEFQVPLSKVLVVKAHETSV